jgi:hypothetical protein
VRRSPRVYCGISSLSANSSSLCRQMLLKTGETTPPYEQCQVMRSAGLPALVTATLRVEHYA